MRNDAEGSTNRHFPHVQRYSKSPWFAKTLESTSTYIWQTLGHPARMGMGLGPHRMSPAESLVWVGCRIAL